jgi:hypothetical protein
MKITINPPPQDMRCEICGKHVDNLEPFEGFGREYFEAPKDWPEEDKLLYEYLQANSVTKDKKLFRNYREFLGIVSASWECRNCVSK